MNNEKNYTLTSCTHCHVLNKVLVSKIQNNSAICGKCQAPLVFHQLVTDIDETGLMKIIQKSELPVIVDFWAPWCGPCRSFAPTFESFSKISEGKMVFLKINTEKFPNISSHFNIRGIPSLIIFKNGKEIARQSGALPLEHLRQWVTPYY